MAKNFQRAKAHIAEQKEFDEETLQIDRVTRVVKGGRRLRFRCTVAVGDRKGRVGLGIGKASEVAIGIKKAIVQAKKNVIRVPIVPGDTIPHPVKFKYKAARLMMMPAAPGTGVIAGGALRKILNLAGVKNILSKDFGSRNILVTAQASIMALKQLRPSKRTAKPAAPAAAAKPEENNKKEEGEKENQNKK
ncbi:30S ribosomal protein S5 [Candidatus Peregrinibacteria bacterium]|nr:30S ribosomal protein S5 [Candidatus Peregrinibacteria bacterium]